MNQMPRKTPMEAQHKKALIDLAVLGNVFSMVDGRTDDEGRTTNTQGRQ